MDSERVHESGKAHDVISHGSLTRRSHHVNAYMDL